MSEILILEDDFLTAQDYKQAFEAVDHSVTVAINATEALALCRAHRFDAAVVDIFIQQGGEFVPDGGMSFLTGLRHPTDLDGKTKSQIPVVAVSGAASIKWGSNHLKTARVLGANAQVQKPIPAAELVLLVEEHLREA